MIKISLRVREISQSNISVSYNDGFFAILKTRKGLGFYNSTTSDGVKITIRVSKLLYIDTPGVKLRLSLLKIHLELLQRLVTIYLVTSNYLSSFPQSLKNNS